MLIPSSPEALTATWLTAVLKRAPGERKIRVTSFMAAPLVQSQGFYGQIVRLHLEVEGDTRDVPRSLIAKFSSATPEMRQRSIDSYEREVRFYQRLAQSTALPTPICYYADIDTETGDHILLLQDLAPMQSGSRVAGCSSAQASLAIEQIAKLHTRWWGRTDAVELEWLAEPLDAGANALRQQYEEWWPRFYQQANEHLPDALIVFSQTLGRHRATLRQHTFSSSPRTLIHRDYQLDNLFFAPSLDTPATAEQGAPFAVIDWQFLSRGRGVWDVAYFLSENLLPAARRAIEMELLASYHQTLVDHGIHDYSFAQCLYDYRLSLLQRHTALVSTIAAMPFSQQQRHLHINILLPRNIAAILDHHAHELL